MPNAPTVNARRDNRIAAPRSHALADGRKPAVGDDARRQRRLRHGADFRRWWRHRGQEQMGIEDRRSPRSPTASGLTRQATASSPPPADPPAHPKVAREGSRAQAGRGLRPFEDGRNRSHDDLGGVDGGELPPTIPAWRSTVIRSRRTRAPRRASTAPMMTPCMFAMLGA